MKVVHILYSGLGGHGSVFFSFARADNGQFIKLSAVFCGVEPLREEYKEKCAALGIPCVYVKKKSGLDLSSYRKIIFYLSEYNPDIIFLHGSAFIIPAYIYKCTHGSVQLIVRDTQAHHLKSLKEWIWLTLSIVLATKIIFLTKEAAIIVFKKFKWIISSGKINVIANGIPMPDLYSKPTNETNLIRFGMQSRLQLIKDHPTLINAFNNLVRVLPDYNFYLMIAGSGDTLYELKAQCVQLGISDKVIFTGMLNEEELNDFLSNIDIYVHASFGESMSTSIMQAMAKGLPIIASDVFGINNMINENTGILVPAKDVDKMTIAMMKLVLDKSKRSALGKQAREYAEEHFSNHRMFRDYQNLFYSSTIK